MNKEDKKWLEQIIKENKESYNELTYTYCPFSVLYQLQEENQQLKEKCEKQQFAIVENCDLRLEIEQLKQIEKEHQKINGELREEIYEYTKSIDLWANKYNEEIDKKKEFEKWLEDNWKQSQDIWFVKIINKMQELEKGISEVVKDE